MKKIKPLIFCLVETRADNGRLDKFCCKLSNHWAWAAIVADGYSGGILVFWQKHLGKVTPLVKSRYVLHLVITNSKNESWVLSTVYNSSHIRVQSSVWLELSGIASTNLPAIIIGDFNVVASLNEFQGGAYNYYRRKARLFSDFIFCNNLLEARYSGSSFTWCNNQSGTARKWASCHDAVREAWNFKPHSNPMHAFSHLISRARSNLISWKNRGLCSIVSNISRLEMDILDAESMDAVYGNDYNAVELLYPLYNKLAALQRQNSIKWAQRARLMWVLCGDQNTSLFHNSIRSRNHQNSIPFITDSNGIGLLNSKDIENAFCDFYTNLWSDQSALSVEEVYLALPNDLPTISAGEALALTVSILNFSVSSGMKSVISLFDAVSHFFNNSVLPNSWGRTYITLVPKKPNPNTVVDFRPISLCNVCYKIISKLLTNRLKDVLPKVIGREQCGFVSNRSPFDNIIALQEVVHSMDRDTKNPPRMLVKLDIEKAYDTLSWNATLATLLRMNFPSKWISCVQACISSASFSLLINKQPSSWFKSTRGLRQGDPLSSYLFIIVAQNLTNLLNFAKRLSMIPGFNPDLNYNFNHLMYADDLILITHASRKTARNINLCLSMYERITGQKANKSKSELFFPSRFNCHLKKSICNILHFNSGSFPFKYLGIFVSPKRLALSNFSHMLDKTERALSFWKLSNISKAGKSVLINSVIMSIPMYYLSVYPVPDSFLDRIAKAARLFFWSKSGNRKGMNSVSWIDITSHYTEGGLSIRNLRAAKISLMAKNVLGYLNHRDAIWVDILHHKYGQVNFWTDSIPANCSWFFRGLWYNANIIKPHLWMHHFDVNRTDFMLDPWYFDIPLAFKPTYINMNYDQDSLSMTNLFLDNAWNFNFLLEVFGDNLNFEYLINDKAINCYNNVNRWVWFPKSGKHLLTSMVYAFFNNSAGNLNPWNGWGNIWHLNIAPRTKHFIWLLLHNGVKMYEYLYRLNLGPQTLCKLCNLDVENSDHLFNTCPKAQLVWNLVSNFIGKHICFPEGFSSGNWILPANSGYTKFDQSVIAVVSWFIWKSRCNLIFRNETPDLNSIPIRAISHVREYSLSSSTQLGKQLIFTNFTLTDNPFLFVSSVGSSEKGVFGAGCCCNSAESVLEAEALSLLSALGSMFASNSQINTILIASVELLSIIKSGDSQYGWRFSPLIASITDFLLCLGLPQLHLVPKDWLSIANSLALHGVNSHAFTLYHQGRDLPYWLMKQFIRSGFSL
ncbi:uncharacterized protein LOC120276131 [Dioscorea cayenensis subsp. rotundata]|uniref:Uncharacterized protein LOC120276131 n=1 Tax=Dioscorea cayennensis subsp. rotundata TaxID=55577 RepID=A0AB40CKR3_DIOCR|nr:uncharacterized protein LOC120276131 [Dioscorea cayenensis subsp. rotundata]